MAMGSVQDREFNKFTEVDGKPAVDVNLVRSSGLATVALQNLQTNLKALEMQNISLNNFVITATDEVVYDSNGSLIRWS